MEKALLKYYLDQGLSLSQIGVLVNREASTVGYWVRRQGLVANGRAKYAPRGGLSRSDLEPLVDRGLSLREMAKELEVSASTVRHWLKRFDLSTRRRRRLYRGKPKPRTLLDVCRRHGTTTYVLESSNAFRCKKCRAENVARWRRKVKAMLVEEAGGRCTLCGYDRHVGALHFHHRDPSEKVFSMAQNGGTRALAKAREEVAKCVLLCANCHAEVEGGITELPVK
jgi:transposase